MTVDPCSGSHQRAEIVHIARSWIGTPYIHQASVRKIGTDCLGLVRGIWRSVIGPEPEVLRAYSPDWAEASGREDLLTGLRRHMLELPSQVAQPGDVVIFRMLARGPAKHLAVLSSDASEFDAAAMIHAYSGHAVCETVMGPAWARRAISSFRFPLG
ncbi:MAG: NlpC/P60 family protein [Pseudomonadota bacterium]